MRFFKMILFIGILCSFLTVATVGCEKGTGEKVGEKVDEAVDSAKEAVKD